MIFVPWNAASTETQNTRSHQSKDLDSASNSLAMSDRLFSINEVPDYQKSNYIYTGYRKDLTQWQCIKSIFLFCNETVNIWTHLLGAFLFLALTFSINDFVKGLKHSTIEDHVIVTVFCLCFLCCLLFSSSYHIFKCHSKEQFDYCFRLDLAGISISLCGVYFPSFYYGFYCQQLWRRFYTGSVFVLILANVAFQIRPRRIYSEKRDTKRIALFVLMVLFGIVPACHWVIMHGGISHPMIQEFLPKVIIMYLIAGAAFIFYVTRIPERFFPGYCDYIGASHQWWHLLILSAFIWWYITGLKLLYFTKNNNCQ